MTKSAAQAVFVALRDAQRIAVFHGLALQRDLPEQFLARYEQVRVQRKLLGNPALAVCAPPSAPLPEWTVSAYSASVSLYLTNCGAASDFAFRPAFC